MHLWEYSAQMLKTIIELLEIEITRTIQKDANKQIGWLGKFYNVTNHYIWIIELQEKEITSYDQRKDANKQLIDSKIFTT